MFNFTFINLILNYYPHPDDLPYSISKHHGKNSKWIHTITLDEICYISNSVTSALLLLTCTYLFAFSIKVYWVLLWLILPFEWSGNQLQFLLNAIWLLFAFISDPFTSNNASVLPDLARLLEGSPLWCKNTATKPASCYHHLENSNHPVAVPSTCYKSYRTGLR